MATDSLQLRHQLLCPGVGAHAGAYDTKRHHVLVFDARNLALRLFSLRRELKSVPLVNETASTRSGEAAANQQQQGQDHVKRFASKVNRKVHGGPLQADSAQKAAATSLTTVSSLSLTFSAAIDAFICVYAAKAAAKKGASSSTTCNIEFFEPATLTRLANYPVPPLYSLSCSFFDQSSSRLVLATEQASPGEVDRSEVPTATVHSVDVLQLSRRAMRSQASTDSVRAADPLSFPEPIRRSTMLCIEKMKARARHHTPLAMIVGSKGLNKLYALDGRDQVDRKQGHDESNHTILVWRLEVRDLPQYIALCRVTLQERITAMALSQCDKWLFTGTFQGVLKVWNVSDENIDVTKPSIAASTDASVDANGNTGLATIQITGETQPDNDLASIGIITSETGGGLVYHWRFVGFSGPATNSEQSPTLELLGRYAPAREINSPTKSPCCEKNCAMTTTPLCVEVNTGSSVESMVIVLRGDLLHVLKVQARLVEVCAWPEYENVVCIRQTTPGDGFVCLNKAFSSSVRVFTASSDRQNQRFQQSLLNATADGASRISAVDTVMSTKSSESFVVCGWTSGLVEIYSLKRNERAALLQDQHLNASITAITVCSGITNDGCAPIGQPQRGRAWENGKAQSARQAVGFFVVVGIEDGSMFGWEAKDAVILSTSNKPTSSRLVLAATSSVTGAHATHISHLQRLVNARSTTLLCSLGADASVKIWQAPSLTMVAYLNAVPSSHGSMVPSCLSVVYRNTTPTATESKPFLTVGYNDGTLAVWSMPSKRLAFSELTVSSSHGRRVTAICSFQSTAEPLFLSSSLDMTVVMWAIVENTVEERKYFDVGAPVVDFCLQGAHVFLAFAHQVCVLNLAGSVIHSTQSAQQTPSTPSSSDRRAQQTDIVDTPITEHPRQSSEQTDFRAQRAHDYLSVSIPSATRREPKAAQPMDKATDTYATAEGPTEVNTLVGWQMESEPEDEAQRAAVRVKLFELIERTGSHRRVPFESLTDFIVDVAGSKCSRQQAQDALVARARLLGVKLDGSIDAETALALVQDVMANPSCANDMPVTKQGKPTKKATRTKRKTVTKPSRKAIISYNSMGEKSIRWVEVEPTVPSLQSQPSLAATPGFLQSGRAPDSARVPSPQSRDLATPITGSISPFFSTSDDAEADVERSVERATEMVEVARPMTRTRRLRKKSVAECLGARTPILSFVGEPLVQHLKLSVGFRPLWSSDYCWCRPAVPLIVIDTGSKKYDKGSSSQRCNDCGKRMHVLEMSTAGYRPHFSVRSILEIICEVYAKLSTDAHAQLFKKSSSGKKPNDVKAKPEPITVFGALISVMKRRYGMQDVVELKVKQLLVSMCHFTSAVDAIAVFGEFLAMHASADSSLDEHVPHELIALCACCYSWLYSREMVAAGNAVVGSGSGDSCHDESRACDTSCSRDHWQFVPLSCALLCAQENLMYPLVNPGFLRNILMFMGEYAQETRWLPAIDLSGGDDSIVVAPQRISAVSMRWIEVHRFLRLIVGEWRQQNESFRVAERVLFLQSSDGAEVDVEIVEKLRLILSCLVFYDHDRVGVMSIIEFQNILRRLRYLWPNENMTEAEAVNTVEVSITFENAVRAACARFADRERDGQLCYLDFWAMLYVVGMKTRSMIKFREIPSFCRDYKLEVAPQLSEVVLCFMERSCTVLLPHGLLVGTSSFDQKATRQHVRRVGGLHDGTFDLKMSLKVSLSATSLIASTKQPYASAHDDLFVESSTLVLRQSASVSAVDRFGPISIQGASEVANVQDKTHNETRIGYQKKQQAPLPVSSLGLESLSPSFPSSLEAQSSAPTKRIEDSAQYIKPVETVPGHAPEAPSADQGHLYIQFHDVTPRRIRPRRAAFNDPVISEDGDRMSVGTLESGMDIEFHELPLGDQPVYDEPVDDDPVEVTAAVDFDAEDDDDSSVGGSPQSSAREHATLLRRRSSTTVVRVPSVGKGILTALLPPCTTVIFPESTSERSPLRSDRQRSASMTSIAIAAATNDTLPSVVATTRLSLASALTVPVPISNTDMQSGNGPIEEPSKDMKTAFPSLDITRDGMVSVAHTEDYDDERDADESEPHTGSASSSGEVKNDASTGVDGPSDIENRVVALDGNTEVDQSTTLTALIPEALDITPESADQLSESQSEQTLIEKPEHADLVGLMSVEAQASKEAADVEISPSTTAIDDSMGGESSFASSFTATNLLISMEEAPTEALPIETEAAIADSKGTQEITLPIIDTADEVVDHTMKGSAVPVIPLQLPTVGDTPKLLPFAVDTNLLEQQTPNPASDTSDRPSTSQSNHTFRFSQQPNFRSGAQSFNNPFRGTQWSPRNDSDSESEGEAAASNSVPKGRPFIREFNAEGDEEDGDDNIHDMELQLSETSRRRLRPQARSKRQPLSCRASSPGCDDDTQLDDIDMLSERSGNVFSSTPRLMRRFDAGSVLYGGDSLSDLGEGIALSSDAEELIQRRWATLFKEAEVAMFSPLKQAMEKKMVEQRFAEELQSQLRKKRQEEAARDAQRLRNSATGPNGEAQAVSATAGSPNFRQERVRRESCRQLHVELEVGDSVRGECRDLSDVQYFHFHLPEDERSGSIITLVLRVIAGDADVYLSTNTLVPSATDYMWRSLRSTAANNFVAMDSSPAPSSPIAVNDAHRIVLYPNDVVRARSLAISSTASPNKQEGGGKRLSFYVAVIASTPSTLFTLAIMRSGQKTEPSRAMQTVDYFIDRFNSFLQTFGGTGATGRSSEHGRQPPSSRLAAPRPRQKPETRQEFVKRIKAATEHRVQQQDMMEKEVGDVDGISEVVNATIVDDTESDPDAESFQHLLEMLGETTRRRSGSRGRRIVGRRSSFLLDGPNSEQRELLQDEEARLQQQISSLTVNADAIDVDSLFEEAKPRRKKLSSGMIRTRAISQRLSPLKHDQSSAPNRHAASMRVAKFAPRPVAYSLSKLEPSSTLGTSSSQPVLGTVPLRILSSKK